MPEIIELLKTSVAIDARLQKPAEKPEQKRTPTISPVTYSIYKITEGEKGQRASKAGLTMAEAEQWVAKRPDDKYDIEQE